MSATEEIKWFRPSERMPDADETVLCRWKKDDMDEPVWFGFTDGERWLDSDGLEAPAPIEWTPIPLGSGRT